jgi:hypothetical protein
VARGDAAFPCFSAIPWPALALVLPSLRLPKVGGLEAISCGAALLLADAAVPLVGGPSTPKQADEGGEGSVVSAEAALEVLAAVAQTQRFGMTVQVWAAIPTPLSGWCGPVPDRSGCACSPPPVESSTQLTADDPAKKRPAQLTQPPRSTDAVPRGSSCPRLRWASSRSCSPS